MFGDRDTGAYLVKFSWTAIERHVPVKGAASPGHPARQPPVAGGLVQPHGRDRSTATSGNSSGEP